MESFLKKILTEKVDDEAHRYFVRFGKGQFNRRFLIKVDKGKEKIKIRTSFEWANDLVKFAKENKELKFSGKILSKDNLPGRNGKKKAGVFIYELEEANIDEFEDAYSYLLDVDDSEIMLKIKKSLPKPGKDAGKIDDKFCAMDLAMKYWPQVREVFLWDAPECKKAVIEHDLTINEIVFPVDEKDPVKIREKARRKGKILRRIEADGKEFVKEYQINA